MQLSAPTANQEMPEADSLADTHSPIHAPTQPNLLDDGLHSSGNLLAPQLILTKRDSMEDNTAILFETDDLVASLPSSNNHGDARYESIEEQEHAGRGDEANVPLQDSMIHGPAQSNPAQQVGFSTHDCRGEPYPVNGGPVDDRNEPEDGCPR